MAKEGAAAQVFDTLQELANSGGDEGRRRQEMNECADTWVSNIIMAEEVLEGA